MFLGQEQVWGVDGNQEVHTAGMEAAGSNLVKKNKSVQMTQLHSFLWLSNIALYIYTTSSLSIHLSMDI